MAKYYQSNNNLPTVEKIWEYLQPELPSICRKSPDRRKKVELFFPDAFCKELFSRSPSYLSWFLHRTLQAKPLSEYLYALFSEDPLSFLREMTDKCLKIVYDGNQQIVTLDLLLILLQAFTKSHHRVFEPHTKSCQFLEALCYRSPARALTLFLLLASINEKHTEVLEQAELLWKATAGVSTPSTENLYRFGLARRRVGAKEEALKAFTEALSSRDASPEQLGSLCLLLGTMYRFGEGTLQDLKKASSFYEKALSYENYGACLPLFELEGKSGEKALSWLLLGADHGQKDCQYELGKSWFFGNDLVCGKVDLSKAEAYLTSSADGDDSQEGNAAAQYLLSRLYFQKGTKDSKNLGLFYLTKAAKNGIEDAKNQLLTIYANENSGAINLTDVYPEEASCNAQDDESFEPSFVITNSLSRQALHLLSTLPDSKAQILVCGFSGDRLLPKELTHRCAKPDSRSILDCCADLLKKDALPRIYLLLLDDKETKNLSDCRDLLNLFRSFLRAGGEDLQREFVKNVCICLKSDQKITDSLTESLLNQMSPFFLRLILMDPGRIAAEQLLDNYPLFLHAVSSRKNSTIHTALIGNGPSALWFLKDSLTLLDTSEFPFSLTCISEKEPLEQTFQAECPSYMDKRISIPRCFPDFYRTDTALEALLTMEPSADDANSVENKILEAVMQAEYIVIDTGNDTRNIALGTLLREETLRRTSSFEQFPLIAIYCEDPQIASLVNTMTVGSVNFGFAWYNNYDLVVYGPGSRLGNWEHVFESRLEKRSKALHLFYYGIREKEPFLGKETLSALQTYYSRQYNQDSSRTSALHAVYALAKRGIFWPSPEMYALLNDQTPLAEEYDALREQDTPTETAYAAEKEHERWAKFMMTRGWRPAANQQVLSYISRGNPSAQLYLAKLHPLICSWEELGDNEPSASGMQAFYNYIWERLRPGKEAPVLKALDLATVNALADILRI